MNVISCNSLRSQVECSILCVMTATGFEPTTT